MLREIDPREHGLYLKRLKARKREISKLRGRNTFHGDFGPWQEGIERGLRQLFGEQHFYCESFDALWFSEHLPSERDEWERDDQAAFDRDLRSAQRILSEAIQEAEHLAPRAVQGPEPTLESDEVAEEPTSATPLNINIYNVLTQTTVVSTAQIIATLGELPLSETDRKAGEILVRDFERETADRQRWARLGKTVDALKKLGKPVYEKVAVPLMLEYLKRQLGAGEE